MLVTAYGPWRWFLEWTGLAAITMPWGRVYILERYSLHQGLIDHECVHLEQIERDGAFMFSVKYLYWLAKYGYHNNPYETEAYARAPIE